MCDRYHTLPSPGGMLDQDAGLVARMGTLSNLYDDVAALNKKEKGSKMGELNREERKLLKWLIGEGLWK